MKKEKFIALANKYKTGLCSSEEKALYEKIYDELIQEGSLAPGWDETAKEEKRKKILSCIELKRLEKKKRQTLGQKKIWQWAATILFVTGIGLTTYFLNHQEADLIYLTKSTKSGQRSRLILGDGSVVVLNSNSHLTYPEIFSETSREISLKGEAYFEVVKDPNRPFIVHSGDVVTTVLGTSFNVRALGEEHVEVTVSSGKVKVATDGIGQEVTLIKGHQATYSKQLGEISTRQVNPVWYTTWVSRSLEFDMMPFSEAIQILGRTYNVKIIINDSSSDKCLIRGKYQDEQLVNVLKGLQLVVNFDYRIGQDGSIMIDGNGCIN